MGRRRLQILSIALGLMLVLIAGSYVLLTRYGYNALKLRSEGVDLAQLSREAGVKKKLGGRLSAEMDLKGNGRTISGLMKKAEGRVVLVSHAAQIDDRYLKILGTEAETSLFHTFNPFKEPDGHLEIGCMTAAFDIHGGVAQSRTLSLMSEDTVVIGEGRIDLGAESLDIGLKSYPRKSFAGLAMNPGELMSSFRLEGTLVKPSLALEPADTVLAIGKAVGGFLLFGRLGIVAGMISGTKGADAPCVAILMPSARRLRSGGRQRNKGQGDCRMTPRHPPLRKRTKARRVWGAS